LQLAVTVIVHLPFLVRQNCLDCEDPFRKWKILILQIFDHLHHLFHWYFFFPSPECFQKFVFLKYKSFLSPKSGAKVLDFRWSNFKVAICICRKDCGNQLIDNRRFCLFLHVWKEGLVCYCIGPIF